MLKSKGIRFLFLCLCSAFIISGLSAGTYASPILAYTSASGDTGWDIFYLSHTMDDEDGNPITREAVALFVYGSTTLTITLTNTAESTDHPDQMLAGLFFDYSGLLGDPDSVTNIETLVDPGSFPHGNDLSGEFGYYLPGDQAAMGLLLDEQYADYLISATSLDADLPYSGNWQGLGNANLVNPSLAWDNPNSPANGADFALVGEEVEGISVGNQTPYVQSSVQISWDIDTPGDVSNVYFVYGTDFVPVPEPATMLLLGSGLIGLAGFRRRRFFKK